MTLHLWVPFALLSEYAAKKTHFTSPQKWVLAIVTSASSPHSLIPSFISVHFLVSLFAASLLDALQVLSVQALGILCITGTKYMLSI